MKKKIIILLTFFIFSSCGYTPIYSNKNFSVNIINITKLKNDKLNFKIEKRLESFSDKNSQKLIKLEMDSQKLITVISKDSKGDPSRYEMVVKLNLNIDYNNENLKKTFEERFNYKTNTNKFELNQYEKEIEELLINRIIEKLIRDLSKI
mgnify:CR=1 FL=1|tara:strand:+ start:171 stop:620 length:450 start_codon:yes stop_codon:yes gene_type:complete